MDSIVQGAEVIAKAIRDAATIAAKAQLSAALAGNGYLRDSNIAVSWLGPPNENKL